ncbi:MAG TPA: RNA-binding protein [Porphyromonadaceae bacterium]|nr:RNA-binding protein [Porphyromonadaceae bacterium]
MKHKVLSVKQPWARLICSGIKDIENRTWKCPQKYIGERVLIHASGSNGKKFKIQLTDEQMIAAFRSISNEALNGKFDFGAIIGSVEIVDCRVNHQSIWAEYTRGWPSDPKVIYHWVLAKPMLFDNPILNVKGKLGFWDYYLPDEYEKLLK